jgi:hypothetical protein
MSLETLEITKDCKVETCDLLATHSPLVVLIDAFEPTGDYPETLDCRLSLDDEHVVSFNAVPLVWGEGVTTYMVDIAPFVRSFMLSMDDPDQTAETVARVGYLSGLFMFTVEADSLTDYFEFRAHCAARQVGQTEASTEIFENQAESIIAFAGREFYAHYFNPDELAKDIAIRGIASTLGITGGKFGRLKTSITPRGSYTAHVYGKQQIFQAEYGLLYNWYALSAGAYGTIVSLAEQGNGWGVPTRAEITTFRDYLYNININVLNQICESLYFEGTTFENIKEYNLRGSGTRSRSGEFGSINLGSNIWTSDSILGQVYYRSASNYQTDFMEFSFVDPSLNLNSAFSVRLLRPATEAEQLLPDGTACDYYHGTDGKVYRTVKIGTQVWLADNLAETMLPEFSYIDGWSAEGYVPISNVDWAAKTSAALCCYNDDTDNIGVMSDVYNVLLKEITVEVLEENACGLFVKFLDTATGYYKHWLFNQFYDDNGDFENIGEVKLLQTSLLDQNRQSLGQRVGRSLTAVADCITQDQLDYLLPIIESPRVYIELNGVWVAARVTDGTTPNRWRKAPVGTFTVSFDLGKKNTITML